MTTNTLFHIDTIVINGAPVAFSDGTGTLSGAARFENETVTAASGDDFTKRKRVATTFRCQLLLAPGVDPLSFSALSEVQITARDTAAGRRALMNKCTFASMGEIGGGAVDVTFNVLAPVQWL